ncbi:MAG: type I-G CRISPR-associated protein, Cas3-extension family [Acidimicrobiales bacterium]
MTTAHRAPGLTGDWLNGWLAALGVTVLLPSARLSFDGDGSPIARIEIEEGVGLDDALAVVLPPTEDLEGLAIARSRLPRKVVVEEYRQAASAARATRDWSLSSSVSDLGERDLDKELPHSPFDPPAPRGETLWTRLVRCRDALGSGDKLRCTIAASLAGRGVRIHANGLGFDYRRIPAAALGTGQNRVDPVVECLAFYGLALFPVRGDGARAATRGWRWDESSRRTRFCWPVWHEPLDRFAVDALLGALYARSLERSTASRLGIDALFGTVPYRPTGSADATRGYGSRRLW